MTERDDDANRWHLAALGVGRGAPCYRASEHVAARSMSALVAHGALDVASLKCMGW
jgi:hypothetical protein